MVMLTQAEINRLAGPRRNELAADTTVAPDGYLTKMSQESIGYGVRLEFALSHSQDLRRMGEHLAGLAEAFKMLSHRTDMTERVRLLEAKLYVQDLQARLRAYKVRRRQNQQD